MAASSSVSNPSNKEDASSSYFQKTVSLSDWWLIKADKDFRGKRLAVAGVTSREQQALRVFHSAPITQRYDVFTLETADGIIVIVQGFINKTRTIENGFPAEVFSHFFFGFPPYWEEYAENCFKLADNFQNTLHFDESITDQGSEDVRPIPTPCKDDGTSEKEWNIKAHSHDMSEKFTLDASKDSNLDNNLTELISSVKNINTYSVVLNHKLIAKLSISQYESHPSSFACPRDNDDNVDNMEHDAAIPPSSSFHTNVVDSMKDNMAVEAQPSSCHSIESSGTIYNSKSGKKSQKICIRKSKNKGSVSLRSNMIKESALEECSIPKCAYINNPTISDFDKTATDGAEGVAVNVCPNSLKKEIQNKAKKGGLNSGKKNFLTGSLPQDVEAVSGCIDKGEVICEESLLRLSTTIDSEILKQPSNNFQETLCSAVQTVTKVNNDTPSTIRSSPVNAIPIHSGSKKCATPLGDLEENKKQKPISRCSVNRINEELISEVSKRKKHSHATPQPEVDISQKMLNAARILRSVSSSLKSKEKKEKIPVKRGPSMKKARRKIIFDTQVNSFKSSATPTVESKKKTCIFSPESLSLKRSRAGRLLLPTLEFWRNQVPVYDANRNITGIREEFRVHKGCKSESQIKSRKKKRQFT